MRICSQELYQHLFTSGLCARRSSWPHGDVISVDGAINAVWYYREEDDELIEGYVLGFDDLGAEDWELIG